MAEKDLSCCSDVITTQPLLGLIIRQYNQARFFDLLRPVSTRLLVL
jgi:hypothetical protein